MPNVIGQPDHAPKKGTISWTNYAEPARLRAVATAVVALAASLGFVIPADLPNPVEVIVPLVALLLPLIQGEATRAAVVSPRTADLIAAGRSGTGLAEGPKD